MKLCAKMRVYYKPICCLDEDNKPQAKHLCRVILHRHGNALILIAAVITLLSLYSIGLLTYLTEGDFTNYKYPIEVANLRAVITSVDQKHLTNQRENFSAGVNRVNYDSISRALESLHIEDEQNGPLRPLEQFRDYNFSLNVEPTCKQHWGLDSVKSTLLFNSPSQDQKITVSIIVKSAVNNFLRRQAIRESWYLNRDIDAFKFKTVFIVGKCHENNRKPYSANSTRFSGSWTANDCELSINEESKVHGDIIQSSGIDSYYNITIKTFMTYRWVTEYCPSDFVLALDDDYVFEVGNFIRYVYDLARIDSPEFFHLAEESQQKVKSVPVYFRSGLDSLTQAKAAPKGVGIAELRRLSHQFVWSGFLRNFVHPLRLVFSKWYISQKEYSYNKYPPFITGGAVLMSYQTVKYFYYATYFTNAFKFDDVYIGIMAYKLEIAAIHSDDFMCSIDDYLKANPISSNATNCIGVHDIEPGALVHLWNLRKNANLLL